MEHPLTPASLEAGDAAAVLDALSSGACGLDHHLESQALALSAPVAYHCRGEGLAVPIDFVGYVDEKGNLAEEFLAALSAAAAFTGRRLDAAELGGLGQTLRRHAGNARPPGVRSPPAARDRASSLGRRRGRGAGRGAADDGPRRSRPGRLRPGRGLLRPGVGLRRPPRHDASSLVV